MSDDQNLELFRKYRPRTLKAVFGQPDAVEMLTRLFKQNKVPHALLFSGPSGCGKTTLARIVKDKLQCVGSANFFEINAASSRGIDEIRNIEMKINLAPMGGRSRVWLIDEAHQLTPAAQDSFLKILEEPPSHAYFLLATTEPGKLKKTIRNRCTEVVVRPLTPTDLEELLAYVCEQEEIDLTEDVRSKLIQCAEGSARAALVLLHKIMGIEEEERQLQILESAGAQKQAIEIARALMNPRVPWKTVASILSQVDEDPEQIRWLVLSYASSVLLKGGKLADRAALIISCFSENFYDTKRAGLIAACYDVVQG